MVVTPLFLPDLCMLLMMYISFFSILHLRIIIVVRETRRQASVVRLSDSLLVASGQVPDSPYAFAHSACIRPADAYVRSFIMCICLRGTIGRRAPRSLVVYTFEKCPIWWIEPAANEE